MIEPTLTLSQKRAIAGARGGKQTAKRYGKRYMRRIAKWGGHRTRSLYHRVPVDLNDFAIVCRQTGRVVAFLSGKPVPPGLVIIDSRKREPEWMQ